MKTKLNRFPDDLQYQIVQEYLTTEITYDELKEKYENSTSKCNFADKIGKFVFYRARRNDSPLL